MREEQKKNILYMIFIVTVIIMAVIYFSVPERAKFFENQIKWWTELRDTFLIFPD